MPDGMTSENRPNLSPFASINSMGMDAAKEFPQPESKAHIPDIRMQLDSDEEEKDKNKKEEYEKRHPHYREGQTQLEILSKSTEKHQLIDAGRTFMNGFEDMSLHPDGTVSEYRLEDSISIVGNRKADMSYTRETLLALGYLRVSQNPRTGEMEERLMFPGFAITSKIEPIEHQKKILTADGRLHHIEVEEEMMEVPVVGTDGERKNLNEALYQVQAEMTAREDLVKKLRWVWNQTENLEGLVQFYFMGSLTQESMKVLCDAEGRSSASREKEKGREAALVKTEGGVEYRKGHEFGDAMSVAYQCLEIAALSEKPKEFEDLIKRPGIKFLFNVNDQQINDIFLKPEDRQGRPLNPLLVKWLGEPWTWKKEVGRSKKDNLEGKNSSGTEIIRGLLTNKGNVLVDSEWKEAESIFAQIERFIGGGKESPVLAAKDARDARFIAWALFRVTGEASDLGGQPYFYDTDPHLGRSAGVYINHEMGGMTSCDRVKVISPNVFRQVYKSLKPEVRSCGPNGSLGKYPDRFTVPYFKSWSGGTEHGKRTFQEMRWGYRAGMDVDFVTGSVVQMPEEKAFRLGELPWEDLSPKAYNGAALGPFIAGREKIGIFQHAMRTDYNINELKDQAFFEKLGQYMGISFNLQTVRDGKFRGVFNGEGVHDGIAKEKTKDEIRNYKKKFLYAFWDGIRSLPQYKEWMSESFDKVASHPGSTAKRAEVSSIPRITLRLGKIGILSLHEAKNLPTEPLGEFQDW